MFMVWGKGRRQCECPSERGHGLACRLLVKLDARRASGGQQSKLGDGSMKKRTFLARARRVHEVDMC